MGLHVIGAGFGRTGTASLKIALEKLLGGRCYHMSELLGSAGHVDLWLDVAAGKPNWDAIFADFSATVDFPAATYWRELADAYPQAKIILSVRDAETWFQSTQETIFSPQLKDLYAGTKWGGMVEATVEGPLGGAINDRERMVAAFTAHSEAVQAAFGPERLLVFQAKQGWAPLCAFLGVTEPDEPFPHVNTEEEFAGVLELLRSPMGPRLMNGEGIGGGSVHEDVFGGS